MFELVKLNVFQLEQIEKEEGGAYTYCQRKIYKNTAALYFLSEESSSILSLLKDFEDEEFEPQYSSAFLYFSGHVSSTNFAKLTENKALSDRTKIFRELNLNHFVYDPNTFHLDLGSSALSLFASDPRTVQTVAYIKMIAKGIFSACVSMGERPFIQYQGNS